MTLNITSSQIQIKNAVGDIKFTSDDKLVYKKYYQTGNAVITGARTVIGFHALSNDKEFLVVNINIYGCNGDSRAVGALINNTIPANGGVVIDFDGRAVSQQAAADTEILGVALVNDQLIFKSNRYYYNGLVGDGTRSTGLTYYAYILSYL